MKPVVLSRLLLLLTVLVWGATFVVVKAALADASPLVFNFLRMMLAAVVLLACNADGLRQLSRGQLRGGVLAGLFLAAGYQLQTLGLARTTASNSALLTGLVVVLVPGFAVLPWFGGRRPGWTAGIGAVMAFVGLLLLTTPSGTAARGLLGSIGLGDLLTLGCAAAFAAHLLTLARVAGGIPAGVLAAVQIATAAVMMLMMLPLDPEQHMHVSFRLVVALAVTALLGTAAAFTIQSFAQRYLSATETAVILTMEPVFAAVTSWVVLGERLGLRALAGAAFILAAIGMTELLPTRRGAKDGLTG